MLTKCSPKPPSHQTLDMLQNSLHFEKDASGLIASNSRGPPKFGTRVFYCRATNYLLIIYQLGCKVKFQL